LNTAYQYLGYCYLQLDEVEKSTESYKKAIQIDDTDWQAYRGLGVAYMLNGLSTRDQQLMEIAVEQWRTSLAINPDQPRGDRLKRLIVKYTK
jgi:tetratricopeptide (TPR) repeat protein